MKVKSKHSKLLLFLLCPFIILSAGSSEQITGKDGKTYSSHSLRWFEEDASRRGANHFNKKYGGGEGEDYFNYNSFVSGDESPYDNLRTDNPNRDANPVSDPIIGGWEFCFLFI